jgi:DNA replication protein DnaC
MKSIKYATEPTAAGKLFCKKHGEYSGWKMMVAGKEIDSICPECLDEEARQDRAELYSRIASSRKVNIINRSCLPPRYRDKTFANYNPTCSGANEHKQLLNRLADNYGKALSYGTSFLLSGKTGTGKTHLACAVANHIMQSGYTAVYVSSLNFISAVKRSWTAGAEVSEDELIESYVQYDLLILDELGKGTLSAKEKGMLFRLIDRRSEEERPTIGITKHAEKMLEKMIDDDAVSRLKAGGGRCLVFSWDDYRQRNGMF